MPAARLRVLCGPTAAGKSALAMALAERFPVTVVSADSRQVYRGFDVGTAKPTAADRARVPHRGVDVADPGERYSAARWAGEAAAWVAEAAGEGRTPVVVGGTGFYVRALAEPLFDEPPVDEARRAALRLELDAMAVAELRRWCERLDPARAHLGRAQLARAVEVALLLGERLSDLHARQAGGGGTPLRYLVVDPGAGQGERWIRARAEAMLDGGWPEEALALAGQVPADAPAWKATAYTWVLAYARGELARTRAAEQVVVETRQYAKRQRTWFRHQLPAAHVTRLDPTAPGALDQALRWWAEES